MPKTTIVWFRHDLRVADNPALSAAAEHQAAILPVFIWAPEEEGDWPLGAASKWWLHHSLTSLKSDLKKLGLPLVIRRGPTNAAFDELIAETGADAVHWNRRYELASIERDKHLKAHLRDSGVDAQSFNGSLLFEPWTVETKQGRPYQVFTPFWKACQALDEPARPLPEPSEVETLEAKQLPSSETIASLDLLPKIPWDEGIRDAWQPGSSGANEYLQRFIEEAAENYKDGRDRPDRRGTSRLSPYLHFGEISPRQVWWAARDELSDDRRTTEGKSAHVFRTELGWREFAHHVMFHFPKTPDSPLRKNFEHFDWNDDADALEAWRKGLTGYPIVDAGMRELWATGWMHNRVRMIVGSFLTKDLMISWQAGAKWFWDTLVDADLANNTLGWQWVSGCGADAAPYFRVFNPVTQGEKFDPDGTYVRKWVPELKSLPNKWLHAPWTASGDVLAGASITLGDTYPKPIVDHSEARKAALEAFDEIKNRER